MNLEAKAAEIRRAILENALRIGKGHIASALSWVEIAVALFYGTMKSGDRFVLSKTHGHLTLDAILADRSRILPGMFFCHEMMWPGWPAICSGSLGQGLGIAAGMALAQKLDGSKGRTFCVLSDAELHEGAIWEAVMFAAHHKLRNLIAIVDNNQQSCANFTSDVLNINPIQAKFAAFGWDSDEYDDDRGHNAEALAGRFTLRSNPPPHEHWPIVQIVKTIKGKGIPFMEGNPKWHHRHPEGDQIAIARQALA
jgi:transketolase